MVELCINEETSSEKKVENSNGSRPLRSIYLYITSGCNLRCKHCWIEAGPEERKRRKELDFEQWRGIMDQAIELGLGSVKFTGGEPLLIRDTTYQLMCYLREKEIRVTMETNGTLLDDEVAKFFSETKGSYISVSLDGPNAELHDYFRSVKGAYDRTVEGMALLAKYKVPYQLICAVHRDNCDTIDDMIALGKELKAGSVRFLPVARTGRGSDMVRDNQALDLEETIDLFRFLMEEVVPSAGIPVCISPTPAFCAWPDVKKNFKQGSCGLPHMAGMLADGTFALCGIGEQCSDTIYGNALETPLKELWESAPSLQKQREKMESGIEGICSICVFRNTCKGQCRAAAMDAYGTVDAPHPFCQAAYDKGLFPESRIIGDRAAADAWVGKQREYCWAG